MRIRRLTAIVLACHVAFLFLLEVLAKPPSPKTPRHKVIVRTVKLKGEKGPKAKMQKSIEAPPEAPKELASTAPPAPPSPPVVEQEAPAPAKEPEIQQTHAEEPVESPRPAVEKPAPKPKEKKNTVVADKKTPAKKASTTPKKKSTAATDAKKPKKPEAKKAASKPATKAKPKAAEKSAGKPAPKKDPRQDKLVSLMQESLSSLEGTSKKLKNAGQQASSTAGGKSGSASSRAIESLSSDSIGIDSPLATYQEELAIYLKHLLKLPEHGDVKIRLTLTKEGKVKNLVVLSTQSEKNKVYVEKTLPTLSLPAFGERLGGEKEHSFPVTLKSR